MNELDALRTRLDDIDGELTDLFVQRMDIAAQIGAYKAAHGLPVLDPQREAQVLRDRAARCPRRGDEIAALYRALMAISRRSQQRAMAAGALAPPLSDVRTPVPAPRVLYQGEPGAYAGEAAAAFFAAEGDAALHPARDWEDIFLALQADGADYGVLPIENSSTGGIAQVYDLLAQYNCFIVGEYILPIEHCLMGLPGAALADVREVHSHEQALRQCRAFLRRHPDWRQTVRRNTAESAQYIAALGQLTQAAICSRAAGERYGLVPLAEHISDSRDNDTRFVVVSPKAELRGDSDKISALVTLPHQCGTLYELIHIFASAGLNLLKLESRPIVGRGWEYRFFVDFSGHVAHPDMACVLRDLTAAAVSFRLLGNYPAGNP